MKILYTILSRCFFLFVASASLFLTASFNNNSHEEKWIVPNLTECASAPFGDLITVDLTKKYPEKDFSIDDAQKEFILLETTNDVLSDRDFEVLYVSDKKIVCTNRSRGDIIFFGRDGKVISYFNCKGNSGTEYNTITSIVFDESRKEVFVADYILRNQCLVYSEEGKFLRKFNFPSRSWITRLYSFNEQTLLAYNGHGPSSYQDNNINQNMPYIFLSKKDGSLVSRLNLSFKNRISDNHSIRLDDGGMLFFAINSENILKYGQEFIIAERSTDTVFVLKQDKKLTPLFVRSPSVFNENNLITLSVYHKTDRYLFFSSVLYNWKEIVEQAKKNQSQQGSGSLPSSDLAIDLQTYQVFIANHIPSSVDSPEKIGVDMYHADRLVERLEKGELEGKLKQIAQTIKKEGEDINPVVVITKY